MTDTPRNFSSHSSLHQKNKPGGKIRTLTTLVCALLFTLLILPASGCHRSDDDRLPGHLYLRLNNNPTTLDPALITDVQGGGIAAKIFNGLVRFNENLDIVPDIARSWTLSNDHVTYTFRLSMMSGSAAAKRSLRRTSGIPSNACSPRNKSAPHWVLDRLEGANDYIAGKQRAYRASGSSTTIPSCSNCNDRSALPLTPCHDHGVRRTPR